MALQVFDRLNMGELDDFEEFRKKNFAYLYFCTRCNRSFDSKEKFESCKFCDGELKTLWSNPNLKKIEKVLRYYCTRCEKNYVARTEPSICEICGSRFIHVYQWERLTWDVFRTRFRRFLRNMKNLEKFQLPKLPKRSKEKPAEEKQSVRRLQEKISRIKLQRNEEETPSTEQKQTEKKPTERKFNFRLQDAMSRLRFSGNEEERPSK